MKESYLQEFQASKIDPEIVELNFREVSGDTVYEFLAIACKTRQNNGKLPSAWLKLYQHCTAGGWYCNGLDILNLPEKSLWGCFKPDTPRYDSMGVKLIKYEHPHKYPTEIFALEVGRKICGLISVRYGVELTPANFWQEVINMPALPIIITEGAKKAAALLSDGWIAIGLPGIWGGYRRELKEASGGLIPQLVPLAGKGRQFLFAFDQDAKSETRANVKRAISTTGKALESQGSTFKALHWPEQFKGVDDLLAAGEGEKFAAIVNKVSGGLSVATTTPLTPPEGWEPPKEWDGSEIEREYNDQAVIDLYSEGRWISVGDDLYKFTGSHYEKVSAFAEKRRIMDWAQKTPVKDGKTGKWTYEHCQPEHLKKIWEWALITFAVDPDAVNPHGINLANGRLRLFWTGSNCKAVLDQHSPDVFYTYVSPVPYNPDAPTGDCEKLLAAMDDDQREIFLMSLALSLDLPNFRRQKKIGRVRALLLEGTGSNGKDSLRTALSQIFLTSLVSAPFEDFKDYQQGNKNALCHLEGAQVSWASENTKNVNLEELKSLTAAITGDEIQTKRLYKERVPLRPRCVFLFNINEVPRTKGGLRAILSRYGVIRFKKTYSHNPDPELGELQADSRFHDDPDWVARNVGPAFLNAILGVIPKMLSEGIPYSKLDAAFREMREESCHLWGFVNDARIIPNPKGVIGIAQLWAALREWYLDTGTLEVETLDNGKTKEIWHDQGNRFDPTIKAYNQVFKGLSKLFPAIKKGRITAGAENKGCYYISGLDFLPENNNFASLLDSVSLSASLTASPLLHSEPPEIASLPDSASVSDNETASLTASLPSNGDSVKQPVKLQPLQGAAVKQNGQKVVETSDLPAEIAHTNFSNGNGNGKAPKLDPQRETLLAEILFWREGLGWTAQQLRDFATREIGPTPALEMSIPDLIKLKQALSNQISLDPKSEVF